MSTGTLQIYIEDTAGNIEYQLIAADAAAVWIETRPIDIQDARAKKHLKRLLHDIEGVEFSTSLKAELYSKSKIDGERTLRMSKNVTEDNPLKFRFPNTRYVIVKFIDSKTDYIWTLTGFELWGTKTSKRF
jgi:hypothetical protein